jgi:hypothetical protein
MFYLLMLLAYDSLPPLPDLSKLSVPEPALWMRPAERGLSLNAFAGQFYGADFDLDLYALGARGQFSRNNEWDSTDTGSAQIIARLVMPRLWFEPNFSAQLLRRQDDYTRLTPGLRFRTFTPAVVVSGMFDYSHWLINSEASSEMTGEMSFIFDRITYLPSIIFRGIYTEKNLKPGFFTRLHIGGFHLELGSAIKTGFPSPALSIAYRDPWLEAAAGVRTGVKHSTLADYFKAELPTRYRTGIPAETIRVMVTLDLTLNTRNQSFTFGGAYKKWLSRLAIIETFEISTKQDIKETNLKMCARNNLCLGKIDLKNALHVQYNKSDSAIAFLPDIGITDTLEMIIGGLELSTDFQYLSQRSGTEKSLPRQYMVNTQAGLRVHFIKLYFIIHNITDEKSEIYDGFYLTGRQYAGGIEIKHSF